jgi:phage virion morphogenesis protein
MGVTQKSAMGLGQLRERLARLSSSEMRLRMATNLAEEARTQVANGFRAERDPYGVPWKRLKYREGRILRDTGRMAASVATAATARGFRLDMPVEYAAVHQYGSKRVPQRQMIPMDSTGGLGPIWGAAFEETARDLLEKYAGGDAR